MGANNANKFSNEFRKEQQSMRRTPCVDLIYWYLLLVLHYSYKNLKHVSVVIFMMGPQTATIPAKIINCVIVKCAFLKHFLTSKLHHNMSRKMINLQNVFPRVP